MKLPHPLKLALAALALPLALHASDTVANAIRENLAIGDYAAAEKAGNVKGAALTDDVRVLRSYARLASALQTEAATTGKRLGATTARLDLFDRDNTAFKFPQDARWAVARKANLARPSRTKLKVTVPASLYVNRETQDESIWNPFYSLHSMDEEAWLWGPTPELEDLDSGQLQQQPALSFVNTTARSQCLRISPPARDMSDGTGVWDLGYLFIDGVLATPGYTSYLDEGPANRLDYTILLFNNGDDFDFVGLVRSVYTRDRFVILAPGEVLTLFPRRDRITPLQFVSVPVGVALHNGVYPVELLPRLAASANTTDALARLAALVKAAVDPSIADLVAVKAGHAIELGGEESISLYPTLIADADRQAWIGTLKLVKAAAQLQTAYNFALPIGGTRLFDGSQDLIDALNRNANLLKLGRMSARARVALANLIQDAIGNLESAADLGVAARDPRPDADYLFSASLTEETMSKFSIGAGNSISLASSYSKNALQITNSSTSARELTLKLSSANAALRAYGYLTLRTRALGSTEETDAGHLYLYKSGDFLEAYADIEGFTSGGDFISIPLPARTVLIIGGGDDYFEAIAGTQFEVGALALAPQSMPSGVSLATTPLLDNTQSLKLDLAKLRQAFTPQGVELNDHRFGETARLSVAPLFSKTPVVLRDRLPQFMRLDGEVKVKPGTSAPLLNQSGLLFGVDVPTWESFVGDRSF